jgi:hypothetical protein
MLAWLLPVLAFAAQAAPPAVPGQDPSDRFAAEAVRICVDTKAAAAPVRQLAAAEGWTKADAKALPYESSLTVGDQKLRRNVTFHPSDVWTVDKGGLGLIVAVYDIAERPKLKQCELFAWDLDSTAVQGALKSDRRVKAGFAEPGSPSRRYWVKGTYFRYGAGEVGGRTLHHLSAM